MQSKPHFIPVNNKVEESLTGGFDTIVDVIMRGETSVNWGPLTDALIGENDKQTAKNIWQFVRKSVRYVEDKDTERIKHAPKTLWDGFGDCKSMALLTGSLLSSAGIKHKFRIVRYDKSRPLNGHIYAVAVIDGKEIPVDPVYDRFGYEPTYWTKEDTTIRI